MASLTPSNNNNNTPAKLSPSKHTHSHSHSGNSSSPSATPVLSPAPNSTSKFRSSVDVGKSLNIGAGPSSPFPLSPGGRGRPSSEMLGLASGGLNFVSPESEAIDKWFEDLQNYEATLEEMAAASLDPNFKEELSAIEQWFKVLSEAERTAALYSLIQNCTQVQIRFFLTVLQQMNRADPMTALLSPANPAQASMEAEMEAKLAQMGLKSPVPIPPSPGGRFATPNKEHLSPNPNRSTPQSQSAEDAAATLAQERAKLNKVQSNRISAPALMKEESKIWNDEKRTEDAPSEASNEPTAPTVGSSVGPGQTLTVNPSNFPNGMLSPQVATVRGGMKLEDQLSPIVGGNWASMVNTPMVPMFTNHGPDLGSVNSKLGGGDWRKKGDKENGNKKEGFTLADASEFRRNRRIGGSSNAGSNLPHSMQLSMGGGALSGMYDSNNQNNSRRPSANSVANSANSPLPPGLQAAALQAQSNWRTGLLSPGAISGAGSAISDDSSMFAMGMGGLGMGMGAMSPNQAMMNLLAAQQQVQQLQQLQNMQAAMGMGMMNGGLSPGRLGNMGMGMMGMNMGMGNNNNNRRSPNRENRSGNKPVVSGSGANPEEAIDMNLLNDIPAWLRSLRLHKYTPNFEGMAWKDMVVLDDAQLEAKGVAALGARRKMLKIFEVVQVKTGMKEPSPKSEEDEKSSS